MAVRLIVALSLLVPGAAVAGGIPATLPPVGRVPQPTGPVKVDPRILRDGAKLTTGTKVTVSVVDDGYVDGKYPDVAGLIQCKAHVGEGQAGVCDMIVPEGSKLVLYAHPLTSGYSFDGWTGVAGCTSDPTCSFTPAKLTKIVATFSRKTWPFTLHTQGAKGFYQSIHMVPGWTPKCQQTAVPYESLYCQGDLPAGVEVSFNPVITYTNGTTQPLKPAGFGGDCAGTTGTSCKILIDRPRSVVLDALK
ncbi:InlB B-repeat-containing protein [Sphingomonas profundi]|uniref:InlB B-repeat-containing protein n=1 Tax=Alterirhizorhabdus profundi TaxID=2681549 RepID=UPI0012E94B86|nr:hypothetical protein [Sphingomonas profundi]